jgi:hypothetical protein
MVNRIFAGALTVGFIDCFLPPPLALVYRPSNYKPALRLTSPGGEQRARQDQVRSVGTQIAISGVGKAPKVGQPDDFCSYRFEQF